MTYSTIRPVISATTSHSAESGLGSSSWWGSYRLRLGGQGYTSSALDGIESGTKYVVERIIGDFESHTQASDFNLVRTGLVFGAVQSGKTSSMFGVSSMCIDGGYDIVVILSGTRIGLWQQTSNRVGELLDKASKQSEWEKNQSRILVPEIAYQSGQDFESSMPTPELLYCSNQPAQIRRAIGKKRPIILTAMKHGSHLQAVRKFLRSALTAKFLDDHKVRLLIIDDEADDGSVLDRLIENDKLDQYSELKQLPRHIAFLWCDNMDFYGRRSFHSNLAVTYLAYTATPQANFLQSDHNPLKPNDFVATIRAPFNRTNRLPDLAAYYHEPSGIRSYYTGGNVFYETLDADTPGALCITDPSRFIPVPSPTTDLNQALTITGLRSFLVGGAIRLLISGKSYKFLMDRTFETEAEYEAVAPPVHTALIHPSPLKEDHALCKKALLQWLATGRLPEESEAPIELAENTAISGALNDLVTNEALWRTWLDEFEATRLALKLPGIADFPAIGQLDWLKVKKVLVDEILPSLKIKIINSDPKSDYIPTFRCGASGDRVVPPEDLLTIFVSGNVMSRGITLEGLCTSIFLRKSNQPVQDTQMQMQRWFGYRGQHILWCRLFTDRDQYELFKSYHDIDLNLRCQIASKMLSSPHEPIDPMVLSAIASSPTGKVSNLNKLPLCPGASPFVRLLNNPGNGTDDNADIVTSFFTTHRYSLLQSGTKDIAGRGLITDNPISLAEAADFLDKFAYSQHKPDPTEPSNRRWSDLGHALRLSASDVQLFRPPQTSQANISAASPNQCPYTIAAYLRLWHHCLSNNIPGIHKNGTPNVHWNHINLQTANANAPRFYVGIRFGRGGTPTHSGLASLQVDGVKIRTADREINKSSSELTGTWGSRGRHSSSGDIDSDDRYFGDQLFDYHHTGLPAPPVIEGEAKWRPEGHPGLILIYVVQDAYKIERIAFGICIPLGGPESIVSLKGS
jgi:Z1 domain